MERLQKLRRSDPLQLVEFPNFVYHRGSILGKGSYGKVYSGWTKPECEEVAVKVVKSEFYVNDPKVRENLYREIDIQEDLKECRNVVRLISRLEKPEGLYLVMEKCDYDLQHHLSSVKSLNEPATKDFLQQLGSGIEYMHKRGIVHRDLKPANILLVHDGGGGVIVKLADFGFARHFRIGEGTKPLDMTSLAGTPVFMAPEALECVFYKGKHYDEKVDMWSVGAVLYQCLVGRPAFYAQLQDILPLLKKKGEAIAFKRGRSGQIQYIKELPSDVDSRLSKRFKMQMNSLLRQLLQVSASKRLSYDEFFGVVNELNCTPLDVYCPSTGAKCAINAKVETTCSEIGGNVASACGVAIDDQVLFDLESGQIIDTTSDQGLPLTVQQKTDQWTFIVLSKSQLSNASAPDSDEEYLQSLAKLLDDPAKAIGVVQAQGLSVMCAEVVESANETRQAVTNAMSMYRTIAEQSRQQLYDVRTDLRIHRARYEQASTLLAETVEDDLKAARETTSLAEEQVSTLTDYAAAMRDAHTTMVKELANCEDDCTSSYDSMAVEKDIQSLSFVQGDLSPLLEECRRISHFQGQLLLSSAKALVAQCRQKQRLFLRSAHETFRSLYSYSHTVPKFRLRLAKLTEKCAAVRKELSYQRIQFRSALFDALAQKEGDFPSMQSLRTSIVLIRNPNSESKVVVPDDASPSVSELEEENRSLKRDKEELLQQVTGLEEKLMSYTTGAANSSIWDMIGSADLQTTQVTGTFPTNMLPDSKRSLDIGLSMINEERTVTPGMAIAGAAATVVGGGLAPAERSPLPSPSNTIAPCTPALLPSARDQLNLEAVRRALSQLMGLTDQLQLIVNYQPTDEREAEAAASVVASGGDGGGGAGIMDTWRAATDLSGMSMLSETKLVDSIATMATLSEFIETDHLKSAVRDLASQISYKGFAAGQVVLFLQFSKKSIYTAFSAVRGTPRPRYFLRSDLIPGNKPYWILGRLRSNPVQDKAADTRNQYGQPRYTLYYVMDAEILTSGMDL